MSEVGTLKKGLSILWLLIEKGNLSVLEIMEILSLNRSSTYRLVNTLEQNHFIEKNADNMYQISNQLVEKLTTNSFSFDLEAVLLQNLEEFKKLTGETIFIGVLSGNQVMATHIIPGSYPTRTYYEKGEKLPVYQSAVGKCILAFKSTGIQNDLKEALDLSVDSKSFFDELESIKISGFAIDNEQAEDGVRCIAAPIWKDGQVVAGIAISGPSARVCPEKDEENSRVVQSFSQRITDRL